MQIATEIYSCKLPTRVVVPFLGDMASNRFLLGTANISDDNEIHLVEYNPRSKNVYSECIYKHKGQIFGLSPCPYNPELCFTIVGCDSDTKKGILYHLGNLPLSHLSEEKEQERDIEEEEPSEKQQTDAAGESTSEASSATPKLPVEEGDTKKEEETISEETECIPDDKKEVPVVSKPTELSVLSTAPRDNVVAAIWHPGNLEQGTLPHELIIVYRTGYAGYQVSDAGELNELFFYAFKEPCHSAAWDPLHTHLLAVAHGASIQVINISDNSVYCEKIDAHLQRITCMEYNPNRPSTLCTGSRDGIVTVWHVSKHGMTVEKTFQAHSHWVSSVHYNPLHDSLLLSSSTDGSIVVWRLFSVSSSRMKEKHQEDKQVVTLGGTRESVYSTAWSAKNMWLFCGTSYDGKLAFGSIPSDEISTLLDDI